MKIIEKYLIYEWVKWFFLCFFFLYSLLFIQFLNEGTHLLGSSSIFQIALIFFRQMVIYLTWILPICSFVTTLFVFSFLSKNREILALNATGFSTFMIARPIIYLSIICSILCWFSSSWGFFLKEHDGSVEQNIDLSNHDFTSFHMRLNSHNRAWYFGSYNIETESAEKISLYKYDSGGNNIYRIRAKNGQKTINGWKFENGVFLGFKYGSTLPVISKNNLIKFETDSLSLVKSQINSSTSPMYKKAFSELYLPNINDDPKPFALLKLKPNKLDYEKLITLIDRFPNPESHKLYPYRLRKAQIYWNAPSCFFAVICAIALSISSQYKSSSFIIGNALRWIVLFYLFQTFCNLLGEHGIISEWMATGVPFFTILLISYAIFSKVR